ncbi:MAG: LysM peptidoglycan-binding domain-containing protein, partial [Dehalococcoidia bacterium]
MTLESTDPAAASLSVACPYLGVAEDRETRCAFPTDAHRCFRAGRPAPVAVEHQMDYCLTGGYSRCAVYENPATAAPSSPHQRGGSFHVPHRARLALLAGGVGVALVAAVLVLTVSGEGADPGPAVVPTSTPLPPGAQRYTVQPGDTLRGISEYFGVHPDDVISLNNL